jgi:membrane fusion protein, heavy metal efflux system
MKCPARTIPLLLAAMTLVPAAAVRSQEEEEGPGHMHGPDGRHIAVAETFGASAGKSILSHHDLMITDTSKFSVKKEGAIVEGADVRSLIHKKGDPTAVIHREHSSYEPENGVYGSHMMYKEPGEYVIIENVTLPGGEKHTLQFPIWVPGPPAAVAKPGGPSPMLLAVAGIGIVLALLAAFLLGRRSGRRAAAGLSVLALIAGIPAPVSAQDEEEGGAHMHGPDGRHIAVAETSGTKAGDPLKAFLGPNREIEAFQTVGSYRFRLSIENEEMAAPDGDVVSLGQAAAQAVGVQLVAARSQPRAGGLSTTGQVRPNPNGSVAVNSRVGGRVVRVNVTPGQDVARGHVVAVIDSTEIAEAQAALSRAQSDQRQADAARGKARAEIRRMQAQSAESEAGLARVTAQRAEAEAEVERAQSELEVARGKAANARKTLMRQQQLAAAGAFAEGPVETARVAVAAAEGELREGQTALANNEAQARRMEAGVKDGVVARKDVEAAQTAVLQSRTRVNTAEEKLRIARAGLAREQRIQKENLRDAREVQAAQADLDAAGLAIRTAEAGVARQKRGVDAAEALIGAQRKNVDSARAQVEAARSGAREADAAAAGARQAFRSALNRLQLLGARPGGGNQVTITAPLGGEVETRPVNTGQVVAAGEVLATLLNTQSVWIESDVFEKDLPRVRIGQRVAIGADAVPGRTFEGTISYIGGEVNPETRAVRVRTVVNNPREALKPNMFVRVLISSGSGSSVTVPAEALQEQAGDQVVFVAESAESYRKRVVQVGPMLGDQVVIENGVKPGERVVTRGSYQLLAKVRK